MTEIPREWLKEYFRKSGDVEISKDGYLTVLPYGFLVWDSNFEELLILQLYAKDGRKMEKFIDELARSLKVKKIVFATKRNPKPFMRKYKYKLVGFILEKEVQ